MKLYHDIDSIITSKLSNVFTDKRLVCIVNILYTHAIRKLSTLIFKIGTSSNVDPVTDPHTQPMEYHIIYVTTNQWFDILYSICSTVNEHVYYNYFYDTCAPMRILHVADIELMINEALGKRVMTMDSYEVLTMGR